LDKHTVRDGTGNTAQSTTGKDCQTHTYSTGEINDKQSNCNCKQFATPRYKDYQLTGSNCCQANLFARKIISKLEGVLDFL
jgi:hypothetical protein